VGASSADGDKAAERVPRLGRCVGAHLDAEIPAADRRVQRIAWERRELDEPRRPTGRQPEARAEERRAEAEGDGQRAGRRGVPMPVPSTREALGLERELAHQFV